MKQIIGIMGPGESATASDNNLAFDVGAAIASRGWIVLTGGRNIGVMDAALKGAKSTGGTTVGVLPSDDYRGASEAVDIPIVTGMGQARNAINILSSSVVIAIGLGAGTLSEIALALKSGRPVILMNTDPKLPRLFPEFSNRLFIAQTSLDALTMLDQLLS